MFKSIKEFSTIRNRPLSHRTVLERCGSENTFMPREGVPVRKKLLPTIFAILRRILLITTCSVLNIISTTSFKAAVSSFCAVNKSPLNFLFTRYRIFHNSTYTDNFTEKCDLVIRANKVLIKARHYGFKLKTRCSTLLTNQK